MITRRQLDAYDRTLTALSERAAQVASASYARWRAAHLEATAAEIREAMIGATLAAVERYGGGAGLAACRLFDAAMDGTDVALAIMPDMTGEMRDAISRRVRSSVRHIVSEGFQGDEVV